MRDVITKSLRLPEPHPRGAENDDGAHGAFTFTFDVTELSITLDYNERFTASTVRTAHVLRWLPFSDLDAGADFFVPCVSFLAAACAEGAELDRGASDRATPGSVEPPQSDARQRVGSPTPSE